jgi:hypothetical protein
MKLSVCSRSSRGSVAAAHGAGRPPARAGRADPAAAARPRCARRNADSRPVRRGGAAHRSTAAVRLLPARSARSLDRRERRETEQRCTDKLGVVQWAVTKTGECHVVRDRRAEASVMFDCGEAFEAERDPTEPDEGEQQPRETMRNTAAGEPDEYERARSEQSGADAEERVGRVREEVGNTVGITGPRHMRRLGPRGKRGGDKQQPARRCKCERPSPSSRPRPGHARVSGYPRHR